MRFMIIVKATPRSEAGAMPHEEPVAAMAAYREQLAKAGVLLDASDLQPSDKGWRIRYPAGTGEPSASPQQRLCVTDGPFAEARDLIAAYTLIQVRSREEAMEWARRFPPPYGEGVETEIEVRQLKGTSP